MKKTDTQQGASWPSSEQLRKARKELRKRIMYEELESALRLEAVDTLTRLLNVDRDTLDRLWIRPLLAAGATVDEALACVAQSHVQPN